MVSRGPSLSKKLKFEPRYVGSALTPSQSTDDSRNNLNFYEMCEGIPREALLCQKMSYRCPLCRFFASFRFLLFSTWVSFALVVYFRMILSDAASKLIPLSHFLYPMSSPLIDRPLSAEERNTTSYFLTEYQNIM